MKKTLSLALLLAASLGLAACDKKEEAQAPVAPATESQPRTPAPTPAPSADTAAKNDSGTFSAAQAADEWRSSKIVGLAVYNSANERIGDINDLILGPDGKISKVVIGVGGFLGMGEKLVALDFGDLQLNRDSDGSMRATVSSSKETLESAPDFVYDAGKTNQ